MKTKKKVFMSADFLFSQKISVKTKRKVFVVRDEAPHFLRGSIGFSMFYLLVNPALSIIVLRAAFRAKI